MRRGSPGVLQRASAPRRDGGRMAVLWAILPEGEGRVDRRFPESPLEE